MRRNNFSWIRFSATIACRMNGGYFRLTRFLRGGAFLPGLRILFLPGRFRGNGLFLTGFLVGLPAGFFTTGFLPGFLAAGFETGLAGFDTGFLTTGFETGFLTTDFFIGFAVGLPTEGLTTRGLFLPEVLPGIGFLTTFFRSTTSSRFFVGKPLVVSTTVEMVRLYPETR